VNKPFGNFKNFNNRQWRTTAVLTQSHSSSSSIREYQNRDQERIQFGITIPQGWRNGDLPSGKEGAPAKQYEFSKGIAHLADRLGYDSIYAYDHFVPHYSDDLEKNIFECITLLSALASITSQVKIGQIVLCNSYRSPSLLAKMLSTLDIISNGRLELGIGAGWYEQEFKSYGYHYPPNVSRIKQLDESLSIIKSMWTQHQTNFEGQYYSIKNAKCNPKPIQKPHPTVMVGGSGEKYLLKVAAKHADRYNLFFGSPKEMRRKIEILKEYRKSGLVESKYQDKQLQYSVVLPCLIRESEDEVKQILDHSKRKDKTVEEYVKYLADGITIGTPDKILRGIDEYMQIGVTHFIMHFVGINEDSLKLFNSKVIEKI
jgi:alkanesulfonate monooxygenase SsuD/methylene tetrahydromethanopterin reductase-like flavin-dependent oxidoreductase (luciferase family)